MGFLSSWSMEETVAKVRGLAVPDGGSRKTRRDIVETQGRSCDTRVIFHGLDAALAETMNSTQKKPDRVEAQELSRAYSILCPANRICEAVRRSIMHMVPWQRGHLATWGSSGSAAGVG